MSKLQPASTEHLKWSDIVFTATV